MKDKLYAVTYKTESGDEGFIGIFRKKPTQGHLSAIARRDFPDEIIEEEGTGPELLIFFDVHEAKGISELPDPIAPIPSI